MSVEAMGWVFARSPYTGAAFSVHLAVADSVNDSHENEFWMRTPKLAKKARVSRGACDKALARMQSDGMLELLEESRPGPRSSGAPRRFLFLMPETPVVYESRAVGATPKKVSRPGSHTSGAVGATPAADTSISLSQGNKDPNAHDPDVGFVDFWEQWPKRNGKKLYRDKALLVWRRLSYDDRKAAWRGARNYAVASYAGLAGAMDAFRWLRDRSWPDWQEPAKPDGRRTSAAEQLSTEGKVEVLRQLGAPVAECPPEKPGTPLPLTL